MESSPCRRQDCSKHGDESVDCLGPADVGLEFCPGVFSERIPCEWPAGMGCSMPRTPVESLEQLRNQLISFLQQQQECTLDEIRRGIDLQQQCLQQLSNSSAAGTCRDSMFGFKENKRASRASYCSRRSFDTLPWDPKKAKNARASIPHTVTAVAEEAKCARASIPHMVTPIATVSEDGTSGQARGRKTQRMQVLNRQGPTVAAAVMDFVVPQQKSSESTSVDLNSSEETAQHHAQRWTSSSLAAVKEKLAVLHEKYSSGPGLTGGFTRSPQDASSDGKNYITSHPVFDTVSSVLVLINTLFVGVETNYIAHHAGHTHPHFSIGHLIFFFCFLFELILRIVVQRWAFVFDRADRAWNSFDTLLVLAGAIDLFIESVDLGAFGDTNRSSRLIRTFRLLRVAKCFRIGRCMRYVRICQQILYSLRYSVAALMWASLIIFLVLYCVSIFFSQATTDFLVDHGSNPLKEKECELLRLHYGTFTTSLYSLYKSFTSGQSWGELLVPLLPLNEGYAILFIVFITFSYFGMLNVVAAVFVDSALQSTQHYKDLLIQDKLLKKQQFNQHLREVFNEIDQDKSGFITSPEMEYFLSEPELNMYLESIDIFPNDARALFRLLDEDNSGEVSIEEFCEGCMRLKGEAKSFDIHCLMHNQHISAERTKRILSVIEHLYAQAANVDEMSPIDCTPIKFGEPINPSPLVKC